jgi:hypothetical protein
VKKFVLDILGEWREAGGLDGVKGGGLSMP